MKNFLFLLIMLLLSCLAVAGTPKSGASIFDRWEKDQQTSVELHVNFDSLEAYRKKVDFLPAKIVENGRTFDLKVAVRGRFRRRTCAMPPLKLKFDKDNLRSVGLNTHNDFKLVTHCTNDAAGQEALLKEQLAYELYNTISPVASFRTQLLTITYVNTVDGSTTTSYAILIEDTDELEDRMQAKNCSDCYNQPAETFTNAETLALFEYMIGNKDYCTKMLRNLKLLKNTEGQFVAVPYDFDFSCFVNPSYITQSALENEIVWGFTTAPDYAAATQLLLSKEEVLLQQITDFDEMSGKSRREVKTQVKTFFKELHAGTIGG